MNSLDDGCVSSGSASVTLRCVGAPRLSYADNSFTDVTMSCVDGQLFAHKAVLCAASPVFRRLLSQFRNGDNCAVILLDSTITDVKTLLDIIYSGEQTVCSARVDSVRKLSTRFDIDLMQCAPNVEQTRCECRSLPPLSANASPLNGDIARNGVNAHSKTAALDLSRDSIPLDLSANHSVNNQRAVISCSVIASKASVASTAVKRKRKQSEPKPTRSYCEVVDQTVATRELANSASFDSGISGLNGLIDANVSELANGSHRTPPNGEPLSRSPSSGLNSLCDELIGNNSDEELVCEVDVKLENENGHKELLLTAEQIEVNLGLAQKEVAKQMAKDDELETDCVLCGIDFNTERKLIAHIKKVHRNANDSYECLICSVKIKWAKKFVQHSRACLNNFSHQ